MNKVLIFFSFILIAALSCSTNNSQKINDIIQPINLEEGVTKEIVVSDLFYALDYNLKFFPNKNVVTEFDNKNNILKLTPVSGFTGMDLLEFEYENEKYSIPFKLHPKQKINFSYKPEIKFEKLTLFGQFNSWNRENLPMKDEDGDGIYEIDLPLDPGRYEYKFYLDGAELIDPANPVKVPNGLGDYNSVIVVEPSAKGKMYLHKAGYQTKDQSVTFNFYFESSVKKALIKDNIIALINNKKINGKLIKVDAGNIHITFPLGLLDGQKVLWVAVSAGGSFSNMQEIRLYDGQPAGNNSPWNWRDAIIYSIMIDRFYDGDTTNSIPVLHDSLFKPANYNGGDLQGIIDKIDRGYFDSLGINTLWISPIVDNTNNAYREYPPPHRYYTGYHGYWPVSSDKVEEHFGNMNLAKKLVNNAHNKKIKVLLDFVSNHVHKEHPLWKEHRDWFGVLDLPDGKKNLRLWDEYRLTTWFEPYMPSFDYVGSEKAIEFVTDNAVWWLKETGADGFRHDAVKHVPNKFWRLLTKKIKEKIEIPDNTTVYQIGETFGGYDLISSYVSNGQLSAQFNFNLYDTAIPAFLNDNVPFTQLDLQMQKTFNVYGVNHLMGNLADSHDKIRYMAYADGDLEINDGRASEFAWSNPPQVDNPESYNKLRLHLAYILTIPGVPVIYYGDEIGMTGAADPDNRRMMRFGEELNVYEKNHLQIVKQLIHIRKNHPALRYGDFYTLTASKECYAYLRTDLNESIIIILNKSEDEKSLQLNIPLVYKNKSAKDLLTGEEILIKKNQIDISISPIGFKILQLK